MQYYSVLGEKEKEGRSEHRDFGLQPSEQTILSLPLDILLVALVILLVAVRWIKELAIFYPLPFLLSLIGKQPQWAPHCKPAEL